MNKLSDSIWVTRKCHINAEQRLKVAALTANIALTAYSVDLVIASITALRAPLMHFEVVSLAGSVLVLTASVFVWGLRFAERANQFKSSYLRLQLLEAEARAAETANDAVSIENVRQSYTDVLQSCENHSPSDYRKLCFELRDTQEKTVKNLSWGEKFRVLLEHFTWAVFRVIIVFGPSFILLSWYA